MSKITREEMETFIRFDDANMEAELWTASPTIYRRMTKRGFVSEMLDDGSWRFNLTKKEVRLPGRRRLLTSAQKSALSERAKLGGFKKK